MSIGRPITPEETITYPAEVIPSIVFDTINEMIVEKIVRGSVHLKLSEVRNRLLGKNVAENLSFVTVFDSYKQSGWDVYYDAPGYHNGTYETYWRLKIRK